MDEPPTLCRNWCEHLGERLTSPKSTPNEDMCAIETTTAEQLMQHRDRRLIRAPFGEESFVPVCGELGACWHPKILRICRDFFHISLAWPQETR